MRKFRSKTVNTDNLISALAKNSSIFSSPAKEPNSPFSKNRQHSVKLRRRKFKNSLSRSVDFSRNSPSLILRENHRKKNLSNSQFFKYNFSNTSKLYDSKITQNRRVLIGEIKEKNHQLMKMKLSELTKTSSEGHDSPLSQNSNTEKSMFVKKKEIHQIRKPKEKE